MAVSNQISLLVDLYKNMMTTSKGYGMIYGRVFSRKGLNLKGFARHVSDHGGLVKYDLMVLVIQNIVECLKELLAQGVPVKLDGLGTFSIGIKSKGANSPDQYDVQKHIEAMRINFRPEGAGEMEDQLTSKAMMDRTVFELNDFVEIFHKKVDGKDQTYQKRTPVSQYILSQAEPDPPSDDDDDDDGNGD